MSGSSRPRAAGIPATRNTAQRQAIRDAFAEADGPLSIAAVLERARRDVPDLDLSTIYRNLNRLVAEGWLLRLEIPPLGVFYEESGKEHHHHFHCRVCRRMLELPGCCIDTKRAPRGFVTESHEVFLYGVCAACSGGPRRRRTKA